MRCIAKKCKLEESGELFIITNGETALINACEAVFNQIKIMLIIKTTFLMIIFNNSFLLFYLCFQIL